MHSKNLIVGIILIIALFLGTATISMAQGGDVSFILSPQEATNPVNTTHTVTATVTNNGTPLVNVSVIFSIFSGPNSPFNGTGRTDIYGNATFTYPGTGGVGIDEIRAMMVNGDEIIISNTVKKEWIVPAGFMTGGGSIFQKGDNKEKHKLDLQCDITKSPNSLEVKWDSNTFHLDGLTSVLCYDDPLTGPNPSKAEFDTHIGNGFGTYNGIYDATAYWTFTDSGKKSGSYDKASITIKDANGNIVLKVSGNLDSGNQQVHK